MAQTIGCSTRPRSLVDVGKLCRYSKALRGSIDVTVTLV